MKQLTQEHGLEALRKNINQGLDDIRHGRVKDYDADRIIAGGEKRLNRAEDNRELNPGPE